MLGVGMSFHRVKSMEKSESRDGKRTTANTPSSPIILSVFLSSLALATGKRGSSEYVQAR